MSRAHSDTGSIRPILGLNNVKKKKCSPKKNKDVPQYVELFDNGRWEEFDRIVGTLKLGTSQTYSDGTSITSNVTNEVSYTSKLTFHHLTCLLSFQ